MRLSALSGLGFICNLCFLRTASGPVTAGPATPPDKPRGLDSDSRDLLSQLLSTLNLTERGPRPRPRGAGEEPPQYMLELYERFARDGAAAPSASVVRGFKNEDSSPYSSAAGGVRIHPLLFNVFIPQRERVTLAELRLYTTVQGAGGPDPGADSKVTIYRIHEGVLWTEEVGTEGRGRDREEVAETERGLEEVVTKRVRATDNSWTSFDLTHALRTWRASGRAAHRLEVHVKSRRPDGRGARPEVAGRADVDIDIDRSLEGKHNAVMVVFSDDQSGDGRREGRELGQTVGRAGRTEPGPLGDAPARARRGAKGEPCKRSPLFVEFKDIGWDQWVIQPLGYDAYECQGVCNPPMTSEVSPTKHAIVQTLLSLKRPQRTSRACCVPTRLEPIPLLYFDDGVVTLNHKYEGMVVAECGCR